MLALIQNLNVVELLVIGVVAVLVFGKRLPEVTRQAAVGIAKAKRSLVDLRRQSGIDEELREARRSIAEVERNARAEWQDVASVVPKRPLDVIARGGELDEVDDTATTASLDRERIPARGSAPAHDEERAAHDALRGGLRDPGDGPAPVRGGDSAT